ncbi:MAG TPA: trimeric intracellular cation channel family protein [Candidatus Blautia stercorigallinarum]|uniref:Trimeric intracellular cation channel family protein n=1 Tax=Candidatus Blautia stercorigallinarum TaxID=2838501 RepID=A0A9D1PEH9_9FIRM|nr:trimeric intracellular cation channel family protein [Candidatus Blautia stercorigallinarum]
MDTFIFVLEIIGTVAFASSGAMTAIEKKMDIFGVNILGATTAVGGGMMRDIILGVTPPAAFSQPVYILFSILTSTLLFAIVYTNPEILHSRIKSRYYDKIMLWCDTAGLGIFTVVGIQTASRILPQDNPFFFVFIGVLTGVGGGVLRDIMAGETPYILVREIYASAAIAGGITCVVCGSTMGEATATVLGLTVTVVIRSLAAYFHWNLLRIR